MRYQTALHPDINTQRKNAGAAGLEPATFRVTTERTANYATLQHSFLLSNLWWVYRDSNSEPAD